MQPRYPNQVHPRRIRGVAVSSLFAEVAARPKPRLLAGIAGTGGSGKSVLLDELEEHYRGFGTRVHRDHDEFEPADRSAPGVVLVDDAHQLTELALGRLRSLIDEPGVDLVVAYRPWPQSPALERLVTALGQHRPAIVLGPLSRREVEVQASAALGTSVPPVLLDQMMELTGGMAWLVHRFLRTVRQEGLQAAFDPAVLGRLANQLGYELYSLDGGLRELLLALAAGFDLVEQLPPPAAQGAASLDHLVAEARAAGLLQRDGRMIPLVRHALVATTPSDQFRDLQLRLVDSLVACGRELDDAARTLVHGGLQDLRLADALEAAGDNALSTRPALAAQLYEDAVAAGADALRNAGRRAQAALAAGDLEQAGRIADSVLVLEDVPDLARVADTAAAVWSQRGLLARGADVYRWLGPAKAGSSAALAAVAMAGTGDLAGARMMLEAASGSPPVQHVVAELMGRAIIDSVDGRVAEAQAALIRASEMMTSSGAAAPLPETPAALAALVALQRGELHTSETVIDAALDGGQGGQTARPRLLLLRAWSQMLRERPDQARAAVAETAGRRLAPRDELFLHGLEVGLALRTNDMAALTQVWQRAREQQSHILVDLYSLLPLGELVVAGAHLRDSARIQLQLAEARALLGKLGNPPLWSLPLDRQAVQAASLAGRPKNLAPHAAAFEQAAPEDRPAGSFNFDAAADGAGAGGSAPDGVARAGAR